MSSFLSYVAACITAFEVLIPYIIPALVLVIPAAVLLLIFLHAGKGGGRWSG